MSTRERAREAALAWDKTQPDLFVGSNRRDKIADAASDVWIEQVKDLRLRLTEKEQTLKDMSIETWKTDDSVASVRALRLSGKVEGVALAISFVDEILRDAE